MAMLSPFPIFGCTARGLRRCIQSEAGRWDGTRFGNRGRSGQGASDGRVELKDQLIRVLGDVAYEVGVECPEFKLGGEKVAGEVR